MKIAAKVVLVMAIGFTIAVSVCAASGPMTNDDVIRAVKTGMGESLILSLIDSSESQFDTSTDALINLKKAGVSDAIVQRIISKKPIRKTTQSTSKSPMVKTDKDIYSYGETIRVNYYNAPGLKRDWICIVPVGSPENEEGDNKHLNEGMDQGVLTFDSPDAGKYEVRAYYNYKRKVYTVSARHSFSVIGGPVMEREIDPNNPLETNLPPGKGLVYILREAMFISNFMEIPIKIGGKPIVTMPNSSYFRFIAPSGNVSFAVDSYYDNSPLNKGERSLKKAETSIEIRPGFVYYFRLVVTPVAGFLVQIPLQDAVNLIKRDKLELLK